MSDEQQVFVIDDDPGIRNSLSMLLESVDIPHRLFSTAQAFLDSATDALRGCILLDIRMPGMSGLELQTELQRRSVALPIIFITGHGDIGMAVQAMRRGALDFIPKPYHEQELLDRVHEALAYEASAHRQMYVHDELLALIGTLTEREHQVFERVSEGHANKVIASDLGVSERTVEVHRAQVMKKLGARSLADLVRMRLDSEHAPQPAMFAGDHS